MDESLNMPLRGMRVIDMSHVIAGPMASFYLAQLGAEVIKIESLSTGDVFRSHRTGGLNEGLPSGFVSLNAGKSSIAVDIRKPEGASLVQDLVRTADVFVENYRPGVVERYGLGYTRLKELKPDLVYCSISAYGQEGEWAPRGAYDHVVQALTGMMMTNGANVDDEPVKVGFPVVDVAAGLTGALAIMAALMRRVRFGQGEYIDASMVQASLTMMSPLATAYLTDGKKPGRRGNRGHTGSPGSDTYQCKDGWIATGATNPVPLRRLMQKLGVEWLCDDPRAFGADAFDDENGRFVCALDNDYIREQFRDAFLIRSATEMEHELNEVNVPAARVRTIDEFLCEAQQKHLFTLPLTDYGDKLKGSARTTGLGYSSSTMQNGAVKEGAPTLGEHTMALLISLGKTPSEINLLCQHGVISEQIFESNA